MIKTLVEIYLKTDQDTRRSVDSDTSLQPSDIIQPLRVNRPLHPISPDSGCPEISPTDNQGGYLLSGTNTDEKYY